jgi:hypothetical protein
MKAVGNDRDRTGEVAEPDLGDGDGQIEEENPEENFSDFGVAVADVAHISNSEFRMQNSECRQLALGRVRIVHSEF